MSRDGQSQRVTAPRYRRPQTSKCRATGKWRYVSEFHALTALTGVTETQAMDAQLGIESKRREQRYYRCPFCHGWHLTSKPRHESTKPAGLSTSPPEDFYSLAYWEDTFAQTETVEEAQYV